MTEQTRSSWTCRCGGHNAAWRETCPRCGAENDGDTIDDAERERRESIRRRSPADERLRTQSFGRALTDPAHVREVLRSIAGKNGKYARAFGPTATVANLSLVGTGDWQDMADLIVQLASADLLVDVNARLQLVADAAERQAALLAEQNALLRALVEALAPGVAPPVPPSHEPPPG